MMLEARTAQEKYLKAHDPSMGTCRGDTGGVASKRKGQKKNSERLKASLAPPESRTMSNTKRVLSKKAPLPLPLHSNLASKS
jgi:hypothetical protein